MFDVFLRERETESELLVFSSRNWSPESSVRMSKESETLIYRLSLDISNFFFLLCVGVL